MLKKVIVALDVEDDKRALGLVEELSPYIDVFKIGPALFYRYGAGIIEKVNKKNKKVFLDVKLYDIPNTVALAVESVKGLGVYSMSVHLSGGRQMIERAVSIEGRPLLWGVSVLTSFNEESLKETGIGCTAAEQVERLVKMGIETGVDGIVSSAHELENVAKLRKALGKEKSVKCVVPGIRTGKKVSSDDQQRVMTPAKAAACGADFLVVGRPIIGAADPSAAAREIIESL